MLEDSEFPDTDDEEIAYNEQLWAVLLLHQKQAGKILIGAVSAVAQAIVLATQKDEAIPYHTSILSGEGWVKELLNGHPERIRMELGTHRFIFDILITELQAAGYTHSKHVKIEEQLAIFLYICVTGLTIRHVAEQFQRSNDTISKYFKKILHAFSSPPIYGKYVQLPHIHDDVPQAIRDDMRFMPFFEDAIGAIDGTHIPCTPSAAECDATCNRKGFNSQNCLMCCDFELKFTYVLSGWEGSAADASVYHNARVNDLTVPPGRYYLADAGFPSCLELLVPYRGECYHLAEWGRGQRRPQNHREIFNLRHAQARNIVERIIGILKRRFRILIIPPGYDMATQARIPPACCCIHNIIRSYDSAELADMEPSEIASAGALPPNEPGAHGTTASGIPTATDRDVMALKRERMATAMWLRYSQDLQARGIV